MNNNYFGRKDNFFKYKSFLVDTLPGTIQTLTAHIFSVSSKINVYLLFQMIYTVFQYENVWFGLKIIAQND